MKAHERAQVLSDALQEQNLEVDLRASIRTDLPGFWVYVHEPPIPPNIYVKGIAVLRVTDDGTIHIENDYGSLRILRILREIGLSDFAVNTHYAVE
jgi:hypothetical protein